MQAKYIPVLVAVGFLVACENPEADKKKQVNENVRKAVEAVQLVQADIDIKAVGDPESLDVVDGSTVKSLKNIDYQAGRDAALKAAIEKVAGASADSTPLQKTLLNRSLSNLYLARSNYQTQTALTDWTDLTARTAALVSDVVQLDDAVARTQSLSIDNSKLLADLRDNQAKLDKEMRDLEEAAASLGKEAATLSETVASFQAKNKEHLANGRKFRSDALLLKGALQYDTYKKAIDSESAAAQAGFQADRAASKLDVIESERKIDETKLAVLKPAAGTIKERIASAERRDAEQKKSREDAIKQRDAIVQRLRDNFAKIAKERADKVDARFVIAHEMADKALKAIKEAASAPSEPGAKKIIGLEEVSKHVANAYLCTQELTTTAAYAKSLETLAAQIARSMPDMPLFNENAKSARETAAVQVQSAKAAIAAGQDLASRLVSGGDPDDPYVVVEGPGESHNLLAEAMAQLIAYEKRVEDLKNTLALP